MPPQVPAVSRERYIENLIPVSISSAASPCPICLIPYTTDHAPVLLQPCGHIFGRSCIVRWFNEGANTCPLDRQPLFRQPLFRQALPPTSEFETRIVSWSQLPFRAGASSEQRRQLSRFARRNALVPGEVSGTVQDVDERSQDGHVLTGRENFSRTDQPINENFQRLVRGLWLATGNYYYRRLSHRNGSNAMVSFDEATLSAVARGMLPPGVEIITGVWRVLLGAAREMLEWHIEMWSEGRPFGLLNAALVEGFVQEMWTAFFESDW